MIGQRVGDWQPTALLGYGTQGTVYRVRHVRDGRECALKLLRPQLCRDSVAVDRFFEEARAVEALSHPGIVQIVEHGRDAEGRAWVVMELLEGETLFDRLRRAPLTVTEAVAVLRQIAAALGAAHPRVVHRDLKPENVLLVGGDAQARVVLVDFGIARLSHSASTLTGAGAIGTPPYMSPEQCRGEQTDQRADLYALGCLLYEMICGTPPHGFSGGTELLRAHCEAVPAPLSELAEGVPPALDALALELIAKRPEDRPASPTDVLRRLDAAGLEGQLAPPPLTREPRSVRDRIWDAVLAAPPWAVGAAACALGSTLLGLAIVMGVGNDFLASPNWGFTYTVLVPVTVMSMLASVQQSHAAFRGMAEAGMLEGAVDAKSEVARIARRNGRWLVGFGAVLTAASVALSLVELHRRDPALAVPGTWWASPVMGSLGAVAQGVFSALINLFLAHALAWTWQLRAWSSVGAPLTLKTDPSSRDVRRGFERLEEPLLSMITSTVLVQVILHLSNLQFVSAVTRRTIVQTLMPFDGGWRPELAVGHYASTIVVVAGAMVVGFMAVALAAVREAVARSSAPPPQWPVRAMGPVATVALLAALTVPVAVVRLGPPVLVVLLVTWLIRRGGGRPKRPVEI